MESRSRFVNQTDSVDKLYIDIQREPQFLDDLDKSPFKNTPLHKASFDGDINLAMELMILKPSFAKKLNADGFSPLHLAVQNNKVKLALELIKCDPSLIRFPGRRGMTPFHLVAEKGKVEAENSNFVAENGNVVEEIGNIELLTEFLLSCPESIRDVNVNGETALHITVVNQRYKELRVLTGWMQRNRSRDASSTEIHVLNRCDRDGNTALHLAAFESNLEVVKELLKCMSLNRNILNKKGDTALDVALDVVPTNERTKNIIKLLRNFGGKSKNSLNSKHKKLSEYLTPPVNFWGYCSTEMARYRSHVSDGARNALLVIAALIITATYQTAVQPEDKDEINNAKDIIYGMVLLWGFNTTAFGLSILSTSILLPVGRAYTCWYVVIMVPLTCSFGLSVYRKYDMYDIQRNDIIKNLFINMYVIVALGFLVYLMEFYVRWKQNKPKRVPEPKLDDITKGFKPWYRA